MAVNRKRHHLNFIIIVVAACILAAEGTWGATNPRGGARSNPATARSAEPETDDLALILARLKVQFTTSINPNNPNEARGPNYARAHEWLSSLGADGHWPDIPYVSQKPPNAGAYANPTTPNFHSNAHLSRLVQMASSYASPASPDYHSAKMLEGVERALQCWYKGHPISDNWWDNTIGEPMLLTRILVPLEDVLPADLLRQGLSYYSSPTEVSPTTGENLVWFAQQQVLRGALERSGEDVAAGSEAMQREIRINAGEGIQRDFSFHQHGPQLYNGGYGHDFIVDTAKYATIFAGTRYAFTHEKLMLLADLFLEGDGHMIRGKVLDYSASGRTIVRRGSAQGAADFGEVCDELAALLPERAGELMALKKHIEGTGAPYSFLGNRYFWNSDFMTHQREAYYISVKMVSNRTVGTETIHAENMKGCWLPFGTTWIMRRGDEYKDIIPVLDWGRLPGVTSPHMTLPPVRNVTQPESFVGGVSDGTYGAAALVFEQTEPLPLAPRLKISTWGQKAWFFFDREMVALGAGISSSRDEPVETTLNQTGLHGPVLMDGHAVEPGETKVAQGSWVLHDEIGYVLLASAAAGVKAGPQVGDSRPMRTSNPDVPPTAQVFALWIDHGMHPRDAQYAYAVVPGINARQLAEWATRPPVRIIANTTAQQAVSNDQAGVTEIVFYRTGSVALAPGLTVKVDHPCLALLAKHGNSTRIAVSSPGGEVPLVHLTLATPQKEQSLTFELPGGDMAGKSQTIDVSETRGGVYSPSARGK
jgi:chondroitin AC lyase